MTTTEETPVVERTPQVRATTDNLVVVLQAIEDAGEAGASLKTLAASTGYRYRVLSNLTWKLEGSPEPSPAKTETYGTPRKPEERLVERVAGKGATFRRIS